MDDAAESTIPLPSVVRWFAPWTWHARWQPWVRWTLFVAALVMTYFLSPLVSFPLSNRLPPAVRNSAEDSFEYVYFPLIAIANFYSPIGDVYDTLLEGIDDALTRCGWPSR